MAKILIACEESQRVCIAFRKLGHEAFSCDTLQCSGGHPEWHIQGDVLEQLNKDWDLIIAHPPCTYLSNAGACRLYPKAGELNIDRYNKGLDAKEFFMRLLNAPCNKIVVENPVSSLIFKMPKYSQEIQPYQFGHPFSKKTRLWIKGLPNLKPTEIIKEYKTFLPSNTGGKKRGQSSRTKDVIRCPREASKTFKGIAKAMAEQWGTLLETNGKIQI